MSAQKGKSELAPFLVPLVCERESCDVGLKGDLFRGIRLSVLE